MRPMPEATERTVSRELLVRAPKVLLHDHLDGGLRPQTILDLAAGAGHDLPSEDADGLGRWFPTRRTPARWSATWRRSTTPSR